MAKHQETQNQLIHDRERAETLPEATNWSVLELAGQLIQRYPLLFWGSLWLGLISVTGFALVGLLSPESVQQNVSNPNSANSAKPGVTAVSPSWSSEPKTEVPLWVLGAIAGSCAVGSWLLMHQFNKPARPRQVTKKSPPSPPQNEIVRQQPTATVITPTLVTPRQPEPAKTPLPVRSKPTSAAITKSIVTIVPAEETHPLDWGDAGLAEMMDIRKQRSLASLINQARQS
jgi:hypothetical protein